MEDATFRTKQQKKSHEIATFPSECVVCKCNFYGMAALHAQYVSAAHPLWLFHVWFRATHCFARGY